MCMYTSNLQNSEQNCYTCILYTDLKSKCTCKEHKAISPQEIVLFNASLSSNQGYISLDSISGQLGNMLILYTAKLLIQVQTHRQGDTQ